MEGTRVVPVFTADVALIWTSTAIEDYAQDTVRLLDIVIVDAEDDLHESNHSDDLDEREDEFGFTITLNAKQVDTDNGNQKYGHENRMIVFALRIPIVDRDRCSDDF